MTNEIIHSDEYKQLNDQIQELKYELAQAQKKLLNQEFETGMVEMSVGVLHNIGNILTPSKIVLSVLLKRLDDSPLRKHIKKILLPLEEMIPSCNLSDSEKQKILKIIQILPDSLIEEYAQNINDIEKIRDKQEHIASIIALHMRYSHLNVDYCEVSVSQIIDDAISMQSESIRKRGITIKKEINILPHLKIQESKLLQILVNLLKNAYESIDLNPQSKKIITFQSYVDDSIKNEDMIVIKIIDSGVGFTPEMEPNFFDFGYSTKEAGSGFGLHFCASFLHNIGGQISAFSDGEGKGADFTIYLPLNS